MAAGLTDGGAAPGREIRLRFDKMGGLVPAITQDSETLEVLMTAFVDPEAWRLTLETGFAHYYSRSRDRIWKKGEQSGHLQRIEEIRVDCDEDAVLFLVQQVGGTACHTGNRSCFFRRVAGGSLALIPGAFEAGE
ncbi:MAG: phosphoribosyl-AMP cyclohydrolase [Spirochaetota bacterium]